MKFLRIAIFLSFLAPNLAASAQNTYDIIGLVLDSATQKPVANVAVSILRTNVKTTTEVDGSFNIRYVRQGRYRLLFTLEKYDSLIYNLELNKNIRQTFYLQKISPPTPPPMVDNTAKDSIPLEPVSGKKKKKERAPKAKKNIAGEIKAPSETDVQDLIVQMVDYRELFVDEIKWDAKGAYWEATGFFVIETLGLYQFEAEITPRSDGTFILKEFEAEIAKARKEKKK